MLRVIQTENITESGLPSASTEDWSAQVRGAVRTLEALEAQLELSEAEREGVMHALAQGFSMSITPYYLSLCDPKDDTCPIRRQCVPRIDECIRVEGDMRDPLGEEMHEVAAGLVQRYPDRVLLLVTDTCSVYCRFCTRSRMVGGGKGAASKETLGDAMGYIRAHPEIRDVIISGGDPLVMSTRRIESILSDLATVDHVATVRIGSRVPVTLPQRVDLALCKALRTHPSLWLMTHFNHPKELTREAKEACARLVDNGIVVMNHTVLLKGVNDCAETLEQLFRGLVAMRVRPYYLLQADPVRGTSHLRTPLSKGIELMGQLQGRVSGIALPKLIVDTPGGKGKVPILTNYVVAHQNKSTTLKTFRGELVDYYDP